MLIQCLATIGALYLISVSVAAVAAVVYYAVQYLKHSSGAPGPSLPPALDLHLQSLNQDGCTPVDPLQLALTVSFVASFVFIVGAVSALAVAEFADRRRRRHQSIAEQWIVEQPNLPSYGTC